MKAFWFVVLGLALIACKSRSDKPTPAAVTSSLVEDISPVDSASALPVAAKQEPWSSAFCEAAPETEKGNNELNVSGTCAFTQHALATCRVRDDDYYIVVRRATVDGHELELYINVEYYSAPGKYEKKVEIIALLRRGLSLYRWSNMEATATLSLEGGEKVTPNLMTFDRIELKPEPGTSTSGVIALEGKIRCLPKPLPK